MLDHCFSEETFPNIYEPFLLHLEFVSSYPVPHCLGEETDFHLATPSFQVVGQSNKVPSQSSFLQEKDPQRLQLVSRPLLSFTALQIILWVQFLIHGQWTCTLKLLDR